MTAMFNNVRRISRQLLAYGTADVMVLAVNFLLLPIYTRVLSPREYGALALLLVGEGVLKIVNRWGLDTSFLRFYYGYPTDDRKKTLAGTIAGFLALANGVIALLLVAAASPLTRLLIGSTEFTGTFRLLVLNGFASTFLFLPLNLLRIQERSRLFAALTFLRSFGTVLIRLALVVGLRMGLFGIVLADVVVTAALLVALSGTLRRMIALRFSSTILRDLLDFGFPQVPYGLLSQVMGMADRFVLSIYMPLREVGVYLIGSTVAGVIKFYPVAFEAAWMPFAYDSLRRRDAAALFARMGTYAFAVLALLTVALAGLAPAIIQAALPATYHGAAPIVPLLVLGMAVQSLSWFLVTSLNVAKQTRVYPLVTAIGAGASIAANLILIPRFGMRGAAYALISSQLLAAAVTAYFAQRAYRIPYELPRLAKTVGVSALTYVAMMLVASASPWTTLALRAALVLMFPAGLFVLRFFSPHELGEIRRLVESQTIAAVPTDT